VQNWRFEGLQGRLNPVDLSFFIGKGLQTWDRSPARGSAIPDVDPATAFSSPQAGSNCRFD
jgi:hypothetical protein